MDIDAIVDPILTSWLETTSPTVEGYALHELLGTGGMGAVFRAVQAGTNRPVAMKFVKSSAPGGVLAQRFEREMEALARLDHPGIASIYHSGTADWNGETHRFCAMELVQGALPITRYATGSDATTRERFELIVAAAEAVAHAHSQGVVHRDLTPNNVLVDQNGQLKIVDFGIASLIDADPACRITLSGQIVGTLTYSSPEQRRADGQVDDRTDVYCLGLLLFELLAGALPYAEDMHTLALISAGKRDPERLDHEALGLPSQLSIVVETALAHDPRRRYSAKGLADELRRLLNDESVLARRPGLGRRALVWISRRKVLCVGVATAGLLAFTVHRGQRWKQLNDAFGALARKAQGEQLDDAEELQIAWLAERYDACGLLALEPESEEAVRACLQFIASFRSVARGAELHAPRGLWSRNPPTFEFLALIGLDASATYRLSVWKHGAPEDVVYEETVPVSRAPNAEGRLSSTPQRTLAPGAYEWLVRLDVPPDRELEELYLPDAETFRLLSPRRVDDLRAGIPATGDAALDQLVEGAMFIEAGLLGDAHALLSKVVAGCSEAHGRRRVMLLDLAARGLGWSTEEHGEKER
ncbi:MAG: serine/threonine protein kinase [bacterium]|nr:serine/threonine protein kinase [bacterium]